MEVRLAIQALAAIGCIAGGTWFWREAARATDLEPPRPASARDPATSAASEPARVDAASDASATNPTASGSLSSPRTEAGPVAAVVESGEQPASVLRDGNGGSASISRIPPLAEAESRAPVVDERLARAALRLVGVDPAAERTWMLAINDTRLSEEFRSDLIEDLNDEGFRDPDHVTTAELAIVLDRLAIIEQLAPDAIDEVNAAAFEEAYKDLVNVLLRRS